MAIGESAAEDIHLALESLKPREYCSGQMSSLRKIATGKRQIETVWYWRVQGWAMKLWGIPSKARLVELVMMITSMLLHPASNIVALVLWMPQ
jgi:hypothetical protein